LSPQLPERSIGVKAGNGVHTALAGNFSTMKSMIAVRKMARTEMHHQ